MKAGTVFDLPRALPGYCPAHLPEPRQHPLLAFPSIPQHCPHVLCLTKTAAFVHKYVYFSKSWAAQKVHTGKLFGFPLLCTRFYKLLRGDFLFIKTTCYQRPPKLSAHERNLLYTLTVLCLIDGSTTSSSLPLQKRKCLFLEQQLHLLLSVLPSLCQRSKDWASPPASHKPTLRKGLNPDPSHPIFRCWGAHEHPLSMSLIAQRAPWDALPAMEGTEVLDPPPVTAWSYMKHWKVFDHTHQTSKCTWSKTVSYLFHFRLPWDFSDSSDFSPSVLFISFQWNTYWQLLVG